MRLKLSPVGQVTLPAELVRKYRLDHGDVIVEDTGDGLSMRTSESAVERARAESRRLLADAPGASVDDFLADRAREAHGA